MASQNHQYQFQAKPRPLMPKPQNPKIHTINVQMYKNLMFDHKVVRGNTNSVYFKKPKETETQENKTKKLIKKASKFVNGVRKVKLVNSLSRANLGDLKKKRKKRVGIYVDHNERLSTNLPKSIEIGVMTDKLPEEPLKEFKYDFPYGVDAGAQVIETDLFDFEKEVQPIVERLKAWVLEESLKEVWRDQEGKKFNQINQKLKDDETEEKNKLSEFMEKEKEKLKESRKRYQQYGEKHERKMDIQAKLIARNFSKKFVSKLKEEFLEELELYRNIEEPIILELRDKYRPKLEKGVLKKLKREDGRKTKIVDLLTKNVDSFKKKHRKVVDDNYERIRVAKEIADKKEKKRLQAQKERRAQRKLRKRLKRLKTATKELLKNEEIYIKSKGDLNVEDMLSYGNEHTVGLFGGLTASILPCISIISEYMNSAKIKSFFDSFFDSLNDISFNLYFDEGIEKRLNAIKVKGLAEIYGIKKKGRREKTMRLLTANLVDMHGGKGEELLNDLFISEEELEKFKNEEIEEAEEKEENEEEEQLSKEDLKSNPLVTDEDVKRHKLLRFLWAYIMETKHPKVKLNIYMKKKIEEKIQTPNILFITNEKIEEEEHEDEDSEEQSKNEESEKKEKEPVISLYNSPDELMPFIELKEVFELTEKKIFKNNLNHKDSFFFINLKLHNLISTKLVESFKTVFKVQEKVEMKIKETLIESFSTPLKEFITKFKEENENNEILLLIK